MSIFSAIEPDTFAEELSRGAKYDPALGNARLDPRLALYAWEYGRPFRVTFFQNALRT
jgi:hypothetical protein